MADPLSDYERKRDFERTPEPPPRRESRDGRGAVFVVHRHDARSLHWDLRLEVNGVLCSWAVPKGFSFDPTDRHLAVRTEDHPIEYEDFHGVIPKGQYGAGTMTIWDRGHFALAHTDDWDESIRKGEIKILLYGRRLRGEWHLVKTKQAENTWLIFKSRDRYAGAARDSALGIDLGAAKEAPLPRTVKPMRPGSDGDAPFSDPAWLFEAELEGRRIFARKEGDAVRLVGLRKRLPAVEAALGALRAENALLDGVLVVLDDHGRPSAERLAAALDGEDGATPVYYAFDVLHYDEFDLRSLPLVERKGALRALLPDDPALLFVDHVPGRGEDLAEAVSTAGLSAIWARRADAPYRAGRSDAWRRVPVRAAKAARAVDVAEALSRPSAPSSRRVKLSNLGKVFWPAEGYTKGDLLAYYEGVAPLLLPYLADRPVHMNRHPDGIGGKSFYQRQAKEETPDWVRTVWIASDHKGEEQRQIVCDDLDTLLFLVNLGSIDLHPWLSRVADLDSPDWAVIDLDPKEAPFAHVIRIAREVGDVLVEVGLRPLLKTSGATGLHVYVPLGPGYTYDQSRMFCEGVSRFVARRLKDIATVERVVGSREGKVYVDYGQNRRSQTVVPPYVPRPVRGATVSTPLAWSELTDDLHPSLFTIQTVPPRLEEVGDLFRPALDDPQDLLPAIEALGTLVS